MTSPPGQDPTLTALILAEKALAPFAAFAAALPDGVFLASDGLDARHTGKPYNDFPPLTFGDVCGTPNALAAIRAALSQPSAPTAADTGTTLLRETFADFHVSHQSSCRYHGGHDCDCGRDALADRVAAFLATGERP